MFNFFILSNYNIEMLYSGSFQLIIDTELKPYPVNLYGKYKITIKDIYISFNKNKKNSDSHLPDDKYYQQFSIYSPDFIKHNEINPTFLYPDTYHNLGLDFYTLLNGYLNIQIIQIPPPTITVDRIIKQTYLGGKPVNTYEPYTYIEKGGLWDFNKCIICLEYERQSSEFQI